MEFMEINLHPEIVIKRFVRIYFSIFISLSRGQCVYLLKARPSADDQEHIWVGAFQSLPIGMALYVSQSTYFYFS